MTLREAITATGVEAEYLAGDYAAVVNALNTPRHEVTSSAPGGWEQAEAGGLTATEIAAVLRVMELAAADIANNPHAAVIAHGLRKFSAATLDFSKPESQSLFAALPTLCGAYAPSLTAVVTADLAERLQRVGAWRESDAQQIHGGQDYTVEDLVALRLQEDLAHCQNEIIGPALYGTREEIAAAWTAAVAYLTGA